MMYLDSITDPADRTVSFAYDDAGRDPLNPVAELVMNPIFEEHPKLRPKQLAEEPA